LLDMCLLHWLHLLDRLLLHNHFRWLHAGSRNNTNRLYGHGRRWLWSMLLEMLRAG
jgi:hypothetical protein